MRYTEDIDLPTANIGCIVTKDLLDSLTILKNIQIKNCHQDPQYIELYIKKGNTEIYLPIKITGVANELRKKVVDYQTKRRDSLEKIATQRAEARKKLLEKLDPILNKYSDENGFTLILDKKNVIKGNTQLDITEPIIEVLNKELPSLNLK